MRMARLFWRARAGATSIEYAVIAALIALFIVSTVTAVGTRIGSKMAPISAALS